MTATAATREQIAAADTAALAIFDALRAAPDRGDVADDVRAALGAHVDALVAMGALRVVDEAPPVDPDDAARALAGLTGEDTPDGRWGEGRWFRLRWSDGDVIYAGTLARRRTGPLGHGEVALLTGLLTEHLDPTLEPAP